MQLQTINHSFIVDGMEKHKHELKIGDLAAHTGESISTIRYWTYHGLLSASGKTSGGFYLYDASMIQRIKEIRRLQRNERLTVQEIKQRFMPL
jgi:DNA-binding transcriptional MerR regulator